MAVEKPVIAFLAAACAFLYYFPSFLLLGRGWGGGVKRGVSAVMYLVYGVFFAASAWAFLPLSGGAWEYAVAGFPLAAGGSAMHWLALRSLGREYSAGVSLKGRRLVRDGVYGAVRHPIYSAAGVFFLGMAVMLFSIQSLACYAVIIAYLAWRIGVEERYLVKSFGGDYLLYRAEVPATVVGALFRKFSK